MISRSIEPVTPLAVEAEAQTSIGGHAVSREGIVARKTLVLRKGYDSWLFCLFLMGRRSR